MLERVHMFTRTGSHARLITLIIYSVSRNLNPLHRLRYVFNEHNVESTPGLNTLRPEHGKYRKHPRDERS